jgi:hypothetical protein
MKLSLTGNRKDAERKADWMLSQGHVCADCTQKEREEANAKAATENAAAGLPSLTGTEKQIAWAETIRSQKMAAVDRWLAGDSFEVYRDFYAREPILERDDPRTPAAIDTMKAKTEASWWIDWRDTKAHALLSRIAVEIDPPLPENERSAAEDAERAAKAEATVRPANPVTETVAEIRLTENILAVAFPEKRDDFRAIVKQYGFSWLTRTGPWARTINPEINGSIQDRAVEIGHVLLGAGFPIRIFDESVRMRAITGDYQREQRKWVKGGTSGKYKGWFSLNWPRGDDFYQAARLIHGSRYADGTVWAPADQFEEVLDFAESHGFSISAKAQAIIEDARLAKEKALVVDVKPSQRKREKAEIKPRKLDVPENIGVDDELRDQD